MAELWAEAGLPDGVFNVVHGDKVAVDALLDAPRRQGGLASSAPRRSPATSTRPRTAHGKRVQALGGAKNHMVVLPDADLDLAADAAVNAGFGSAGERCMAISVVVAVDPVGDELVDQDRATGSRRLRTGDGRRGCDMGPLVTGAHRDKVASYVDAGEADGADAGRRRPRRRAVDGDARRLLARARPCSTTCAPDMSVYTDEIFGPVLSVVRVPTYDDALALVNANPYGNGTAIFTNDGGAARRFQDEVEVGMVGINVPIPVPMAYYSLRRLEGLALRRHPRARHRGRALLHPGQGRHLALARPQPRRRRPRLPDADLTPAGADGLRGPRRSMTYRARAAPGGAQTRGAP